MTFPEEVTLPCGCKSVLDGGVYEDHHTCSKQQRRAQRLGEIHQSNEDTQRRLRAQLTKKPGFNFLR
jgi:hypothetical protein